MRQDHQTPPHGPIFWVNNCAFFGTTTTVNMCSKCHKDLMLKLEHAKLAASSAKESDFCAGVDVWPGSSGWGFVTPASCVSVVGENIEKSSNMCSTCRKRVGLTAFNYRCGNMFRYVHR
ncbi:LOW QUALITY PROTEIN: hypothetical protein RJ639_000757 [Escallonia herrerae]|uniref:A20-type domain-containing protein n=1 Tax=Escallonia herrerae TaxID=1293975 RepID=A0AA88XAH9_9ASTE|nr:LOW QUALITY PROTEIN: hypothetical protein RJ639_000757 [Escallonia herrerae]